MSQHYHHTLPPLSKQLQAVIHEGWEQEVLSQLSTDQAQQTEQLHAWMRHREFQRASDLLDVKRNYLCDILKEHHQIKEGPNGADSQ